MKVLIEVTPGASVTDATFRDFAGVAESRGQTADVLLAQLIEREVAEHKRDQQTQETDHDCNDG